MEESQNPAPNSEQPTQHETPQPEYLQRKPPVKRSRLFSILILMLIIAVGVSVFLYQESRREKSEDSTSNSTTPPQVTNFDECVAAGNPVMESYPEQCSANGQTFVNETQSSGLEHREESGKKAFSILLPDGWQVIKPLDQDSFYVMGTEQPETIIGTSPEIQETESFGTDSPSVFSVVMLDEYDEEYIQGTPEIFNVGKAEDALNGKKYIYIFEEDELEGIGYQRFKGDRNNTYVIELPDGKVIIATYSVYGVDPSNQVELVDQIVQSIQLN